MISSLLLVAQTVLRRLQFDIAGATLTVGEVGVSGGTLDTVHRVDETYHMGISAGGTALDVVVVGSTLAGGAIGVTVERWWYVCHG